MTMKVNDVVKKIPKAEEKQLTFCEEGGKPHYTVTRSSNGAFRLYECVNSGYKYLKSGKTPLFREVM